MADNAAPAQVEMAPGQATMGDGVMVYQKTSQCCRCWCCQPNIDWTIHDYVENWGADMDIPVKMYIKEEAGWCGRTWSNCYPAARATKYTVYAGDQPGGQVLFTHEKPCTCSHCPLIIYGDSGPVRCPWCCCLPYLVTKDPNGNVIGTSKYICDTCIFVPKYELTDASGAAVYRVRPETCVGGLCVKCRCGGGTKGKCFRIPFPIREPVEPFNAVGDAAITDLWAGMKHEMCTNREMYSVKFPVAQGGKNMEDIKKTLIGMTLLIDITLNEQDQ